MSKTSVVVPVGRELDRAISEQVFGWKCRVFHGTLLCHGPGLLTSVYGTDEWDTGVLVDGYSQHIDAAWTVMEWLRARFTNVSLMAANGWHCWAWNVDGEGRERKCFQGTGDTPSEAICRVALMVAQD
jgi:hypothetical protein